MYKTSVLLFYSLLILSLFSCNPGSSTETESSQNTKYDLVKVDSIRINTLENIQITDYNPKTKRFLAYATSTKSCMELDLEGNIINKVDLTGEGPGHFGLGLTELGYLGESKIIHGPAVYFTYKDDWTYDSRIIYGANGYSLPLRYIDGAPIILRVGGEDLLLRIINHNASGTLKMEPDHFENASLISVFGAGATEGKPLLSYPESSIYRASDLFYANHQPKVSFNATKSILVLSLPLEQKLYTYDVTNDFSLVETIDLNLTGFNTIPRGLSYEDQHKNGLKGFGPSNELNYVYNLSNSSILNVYSEGDVTVVVHKTGFFNNSITTSREANKIARLGSKTVTSFFVRGKKVYETEVSFPRLVRLSERQFLVPNIDEEVERDYNQYDVYELNEIIEE